MRDFVILEGWHRSIVFNWHPFFKRAITFKTKFNGSVFHDNPSEYIHKLVGFSDGCFNHHKNSFRIGWTANGTDTHITLYAYIYKDGVRSITPILNVNTGEDIIIKVSTFGHSYRVNINNRISHYPRSENIKSRYRHILYPYFGGREKAPHSMLLQVNWNF